MRQMNFTILCLSACLLCTTAVSCSVQDTAVADIIGTVCPVEDELCRCRVKIVTDAPKAVIGNEADEMTVKSFQVFIFREDGTLDAYAKASGVTETTVKCTMGKRQTYVVVNAPDLSSVTTKTGLLSSVSLLADNSLNSLQMAGCGEFADITTDCDISVEVRHICARVQVAKVTNALSAPALAALPFSLEGIYLTNVAGDVKYSLEGTPSVWLSKTAYDASDVTNALHCDMFATPVALGSGKSHDSVHTFYAYPNSSSESVSGLPWSPRCTRVVVKVKIGGMTYFYPIDLPALDSNRSYLINELKITRPGSTTEDETVQTAALDVQITVKDWDTVLVRDVYEL